MWGIGVAIVGALLMFVLGLIAHELREREAIDREHTRALDRMDLLHDRDAGHMRQGRTPQYDHPGR